MVDKVRIICRGMGNLASKTILLMKRYFGDICELKTIIVRDDEISYDNLRCLEKHLEGAEIVVVGKMTKMKNINACKTINDFNLDKSGYDLAIDFTDNSGPFIKFINGTLPVVVPADQVNLGPSVLLMPPIIGKKEYSGHITVFRTPDCLLSGTIPFIYSIRPIINSLFGIDFVTSLEDAKKNAFDKTQFYSKWFNSKKSKDFLNITRFPCAVNIASVKGRGPFYMATISGSLDTKRVEELYGSFSNFNKWGLDLMLENNGRVQTSNEDDDGNYNSIKKIDSAVELEDYIENYPQAPPVIHFKKTFTQSHNVFSVKVGFDTTLISSIPIIDIVIMFKRYNFIPESREYQWDCMKYVNGILFKKAKRKAIYIDRAMLPLRNNSFSLAELS